MQFSWLALQTPRQTSDIQRCSKAFLTLYQLPSVPRACLWHCAFSVVLYFYLHRFNNTQTKANIFLMQHGPSTGAKFFIWCLAEEMTICFHAAGVWSHRLGELYWLITVCFREFQDSEKKKKRNHPVLSRMKYDTENQALCTSENRKHLQLSLPEAPEARLLVSVEGGRIRSPLLIAFKSAVPIRSRGNLE